MDKKIRDIMTPNPVGVYADQTIGEAARIMRDTGVGAVLVINGDSLGAVRRLPVVDDGQIVGIVSLGDLAVAAGNNSPLAAVSRARANT